MDVNKGYAIVPTVILDDTSISDKQLRLYIKISGLSATTGECWASDEYFSELYGVTRETINRNINKLKNKGYIHIQNEYKGNVINKRIITLTPPIKEYLPVTKTSQPVGQKCHSQCDKNVTDNNINIILIYNKRCEDNNGKISSKFIQVMLDSGWKPPKTKTPEQFSEEIRKTFNRYYDLDSVSIEEIEGVVEDIRLWTIESGRKHEKPLSFLNNWLKNNSGKKK